MKFIYIIRLLIATMTTPVSNNERVPRTITKSVLSREQMDGVGARVYRSIGSYALRNLDPFLMLDEFDVEAPGGFPDHVRITLFKIQIEQ